MNKQQKEGYNKAIDDVWEIIKCHKQKQIENNIKFEYAIAKLKKNIKDG